MTVKYEIYYQSDKYDEYIYTATGNRREAGRLYRDLLNKPAPSCVCTRSNLTGECIGAEKIKFTGKPGMDVWMTWTDSHGRPAKRLLKVMFKAEPKGEVVEQSMGLRQTYNPVFSYDSVPIDIPY